MIHDDSVPNQSTHSDANTMTKKYRDKEWLKEKYEKEKLTQSEIADLCGVTRSCISTWTRKFNLKRFQPPYFGTDPHGYEVSQNRYNGKLDTVKIHRLTAVAEYGIDAVKNNDVHHLNDVPWDNRPENLDIMSHEKHGLVSAEKRWQ